MMKKPLFDTDELIKAVKKAIKEKDKLPELTSVYIDKDGKLKTTKGSALKKYNKNKIGGKKWQ